MVTLNRRITEVVNNTGSDKLFFDQVLAPGQVWEIVDRKIEMWRDDPTISGAITSGTLGVRDGEQEFSNTTLALQYFYDNPRPQTSLEWPSNSLVTLVSGVDQIGNVAYSFASRGISTSGLTVTSGTDGLEITVIHEDDVDSITASGTTVTGSVQLESSGGISILADAGTDTVTISGGPEIGSNIGNFFQIEFSSVGITNNTWLSVSSKDLTSNITPWIVVFPCRVAGLGYSNEREDSDVDLEIHVAADGAGNSNAAEFIWTLSGTRTAYKSDFGLSDILLNPGDKVALFGNTTTAVVRPKNMFLGLYVEIIARDDAEDSENYSGDFS